LSTCKLLLDKNSYALHSLLKSLHPVAYQRLEKEAEKRPVPRSERERFIEGRWQCERLKELVESERDQNAPPFTGLTRDAKVCNECQSPVIYFSGSRGEWHCDNCDEPWTPPVPKQGSWKVGEDGLARKQSLPPETAQPASNLYEGSVTFSPEPGMQVFASFKRKRVRASVLCVGPKSVKLLLEDGTRFETSQELTLIWWPGKVNSSS
jgi:hypothetical protein